MPPQPPNRMTVAALVLVAALSCPSPIRAGEPRDPEQSAKIRAALRDVVTQQRIPGMVAAIGDADGIIALGSAGVRKIGAPVALTDEDLVHIGSCTKAMTCAMLATLVADGTLSWDTTLIEVFPELSREIHSEYHHVNLWQLLTHRARLPANASNWWVHRTKEITARRRTILVENLKQAPTVRAGAYAYSNLGYMVAGCMAERLTDATWESLMKQRLFDPLEMKSAGFGPPGSADGINQPWGHINAAGQWQPRHFDNAAALGPAGRVHCTLADWARFAALQLPAHDGRVLERKQLEQLVKPTGEYAGGWLVVRRQWARGNALTHSGSNTMWYATVWVAPQLNRTFLVATNSCDGRSHGLCDQMIAKLIALDQESRKGD